MQTTLFRLSIAPNETCKFAPNAWKTVLDLRLLGINFKTELASLAQGREELPSRLGCSKVTFPTLLVDRDGKPDCIIDSYDIAVYLEDNFGTNNKSLFVGAPVVTREASLLGRGYARFIEQWTDHCLAEELRPCLIHTSYAQFPVIESPDNAKSRAYFLARCPKPRYEQLIALNSDPSWKRQQYFRIRKQLGVLENMLKERVYKGEGPFLAGSRPTHADFCIFALYGFSLSNLDMVRNTWRHPSLPFVSCWVDGILDSGLISKDELLPESIEGVAIISDNPSDSSASLRPAV